MKRFFVYTVSFIITCLPIYYKYFYTPEEKPLEEIIKTESPWMWCETYDYDFTDTKYTQCSFTETELDEALATAEITMRFFTSLPSTRKSYKKLWCYVKFELLNDTYGVMCHPERDICQYRLKNSLENPAANTISSKCEILDKAQIRLLWDNYKKRGIIDREKKDD